MARISADITADAGTESMLRVAIVGHVDHGKSTVVGRLLNDTGNLPDGKVEAVAAMCERRGMNFEWAFVTDALQVERVGDAAGKGLAAGVKDEMVERVEAGQELTVKIQAGRIKREVFDEAGAR